ncbi:MAG TPA: CHAT domain-containing protein [Opitutaceae bacterium]|nr:CHAT domain-containing protein [Opitutaceae bacterium]
MANYSRRAAFVLLGCGASFMAPAPALASDAATQKLAAELVRNWSPADQAYSDAFAAIVERRYVDGEPAFNEALKRATAAGWTEERRAGILEGRATVRLHLGRFADARADNDTALAVYKTPRERVGALFNRIAIARAMGDFRIATDTLRELEPIAVNAAGQKNAETKRVLLLEEARNRRAWGDARGAIQAFEEARKLKDTSADTLRELARCHLLLNAPAVALPLAQQAVEQDLHLRGISRRRPREEWVAGGDAEMLANLLTAADCAQAAGEHAIADAHYQTAALLAEKLRQTGSQIIAQLAQARGWIAAKDPRLAQVTPAFLEKAYATATQSVREPLLRTGVFSLAGELAFQLGHPAEAARYLESAVALIEQTRATATLEERRTYFAQQANDYRRLVAAHTKLGDGWGALLAAESLKARLLMETLQPGSNTSDIPRAERLSILQEMQRRLPASVAAISYANADWSLTHPAAIVVTRDSINAVELPANRIKFALEGLPAAAILKAQKEEVDAVRYGSPDQITLAGLIAYYRECLLCPREEFAARIEGQIAIARLLHDILVEPLKPALGGRKRLLMAPSGLLAYLPFDTLVTKERTMLAGEYAFTLTPSFLTTMVLAKRPAVTYARTMLALGGAVYNPDSYAADMRNADQMKQQFTLMLAARESAFAGTNRSPYTGVFGGPASNLAGSKAEVQMLGELVPQTRTIIGREVSEKTVRTLAAAGELRSSRVLHFAVHGSALPSMPALSCIMLSYEGHYTKEMPAEGDGLLQLGEIQQLPLSADLVTLSACETGLGAIFAGEGVVGLTGAFLSAGGNRVLASLWVVSDAGTVYFMQRFYRLHLIEGVPGDLAMARVKREFIAGEAGNFRQPQFWAPFNLYGGADLLEPAQ